MSGSLRFFTFYAVDTFFGVIDFFEEADLLYIFFVILFPYVQ